MEWINQKESKKIEKGNRNTSKQKMNIDMVDLTKYLTTYTKIVEMD